MIQKQTFKYDLKEIENIFRDYWVYWCKELYTQPSASNKNYIKAFLDSLDLPSIGNYEK